MTQAQRNILWLSLFAIAMAHVEAALVVHLRSLYYPDNPLAIFPLSLLSHRDLAIELARELATLVMIMSVALLAARGFVRIFAAFVYIFGLLSLLPSILPPSYSYVVSTALFVFILITVFRAGPWWLAGLVAIVATAGLYIVFGEFYRVPLP